MASVIDFYFDFSSPYSYIASEEIEALTDRTGSELRWRPLLLGAVFKSSGGAPLTEGYGPKAKYRCAISPAPLPSSACHIGTQHLSDWRGVRRPRSSVAAARAPQSARPVHPCGVPRVLRGRSQCRRRCRRAGSWPIAGTRRTQLAAGIQQAPIKYALRTEVDQAVERGVFGAPTAFVDGEMFWGHDRLPHIERWVTTGPY